MTIVNPRPRGKAAKAAKGGKKAIKATEPVPKGDETVPAPPNGAKSGVAAG